MGIRNKAIRWAEPHHLVGRDKDIEAIIDHLTEGRHVVLVAPPGIGKTSLAVEVLRRLTDENWMTVMVPAAQVTSILDLAKLVAVQGARAVHSENKALRDAADRLIQSVFEEERNENPSGDARDPNQLLSMALEFLSHGAAQSDRRMALAIDDLDVLYVGKRSSSLGGILAQRLRAVTQRSDSNLRLFFLARSEAVARDVFDDAEAPLFGHATTYQLGPLSLMACRALVQDQLGNEGRDITDEAVNQMRLASAGHPGYLAMIAQVVMECAERKDVTSIGSEIVDSGLREARENIAPTIAERLDSVRRAHRLGLSVARRLARGESPYAGDTSPNNITRVLQNLDRLGLVRRPESRKWALTDPFLADALRALDATSVAARASTLIDARPTSLPSADRCIRRFHSHSVWGLHPQWFEAKTTMRDALHGDFLLTRLEHAVVAAPAFQRLRRLRQMGSAYLVYPSATQTRFEHAVGSLALSSRLVEGILERGESNGAAVDDVQRAESIALTRIAALIHDLAALPYEEALKACPSIRFEDYGSRFSRLWGSIVEDLIQGGLADDEAESLRSGHFLTSLRYACDRSFDDDDVQYRYVRDLISGPISAGVFDSLARDQLVGSWTSPVSELASLMQIVSRCHGKRDAESRIAIDLGDHPDSVQNWLLSHLDRYRRRNELVLSHPAKYAADAMIVGAVDRWTHLLNQEDSWNQGIAVQLQERLFGQSDDGFLDYLHWSSAEVKSLGGDESDEEGAEAVFNLIDGVLNRRLYTHVASTVAPAIRDDLFASTLDSAYRRYRLERDVAEIAGVGGQGKILLVAGMQGRSLEADILVNDDAGVSWASARDERVAQLVEALQGEMETDGTINVFVDRAVTREQQDVVLAWLATRLAVTWQTRGESDRSKPATYIAD